MMAAEYTLYTKSKILEEDIKKLLVRLSWRSIEEKLSSHVTLLSLTEEIGFQLYFNDNFRTSIKIDNKDWDGLSVLTIRFINGVEFTRSRKNMLRFIFAMNKVDATDFILLFNGEVVIMMKERSKGLTLSNSDFWTSELVEELGDHKFNRRTFDLL